MSSNSSSNSILGLSEKEIKLALCALKVLLIDGKVEKGHLARLTGHKNPDSAHRVWYIVKNKLMETNTSPSGSATSVVDVDTPTKGPKKTPAKMRTQTPKKRSKKQTQDDDEDDAEIDEKPAKRVKKEGLEDAGVEFKDEV
ncbi:hypothetical protein INS49_001642 [Diaporthe citri]|uniref:uncharacterized protein n=1 Tax=Diaporthe citri TaxID=83186 RepID=UPI001C7F75B6|nr:uncharacterized protein INS49_001642 [Diaporthe citri]KAG6367453.1 hypothetical protein INS49_001642 [Diaporthe citri]